MSSTDTSVPKLPRSGRSNRRSSRSQPAAVPLLHDYSQSVTEIPTRQLSYEPQPVDGGRSAYTGSSEPPHAAPRAFPSSTSGQYSTDPTTTTVRLIQKPYIGAPPQRDRFETLVDAVPPPAVVGPAVAVVHDAPSTGAPSAVTPGIPAEDDDDDYVVGRGADRLRRSASTATNATTTTVTPSSTGHVTLVAFPRSRGNDIIPPVPAWHSRLPSNARSRSISDVMEKGSKGHIVWSETTWDPRTKELSPDLEAQARADQLRLFEEKLQAVQDRRRSRRLTPGIICMQYILPPAFLSIFAIIIFVLVKYR